MGMISHIFVFSCLLTFWDLQDLYLLPLWCCFHATLAKGREEVQTLLPETKAVVTASYMCVMCRCIYFLFHKVLAHPWRIPTATTGRRLATAPSQINELAHARGAHNSFSFRGAMTPSSAAFRAQ